MSTFREAEGRDQYVRAVAQQAAREAAEWQRGEAKALHPAAFSEDAYASGLTISGDPNMPMADAERRHNVTPIDELLAARHELVQKNRTAWALYGPGGVWDAKRKRLLSLALLKAQTECQKREQRCTDKVLDAMAHADPEYTDFLDRSVLERAAFYVDDDKIDALTMRINRGQAVLRAVANEPRG